jgi:mannitol/fructose-specific phosphotransferase system IIA component (Ntr-type)
VVVVRSSNHLKRSLAGRYALDYGGTSLEEALGAALDMLLTNYPTLPKDQIVREVTAREREFPTVLGYGVAVPHTYTKHIKTRVCCILYCPNGVGFGQGDAVEAVKLVFLVLSPSGDPEGHLAIMAQIAHLISNTEMRGRLLEAESAAEILRIVSDEQ